MPQKQVNIPNIEIGNIKIEFADEFNFLGLTIHKHLKWYSHINKIASKISNIIGIMYRLKHMVPSEIILTIYNGLIKPHILSGISAGVSIRKEFLNHRRKSCELYVRVVTSLTASPSLKS